MLIGIIIVCKAKEDYLYCHHAVSKRQNQVNAESYASASTAQNVLSASDLSVGQKVQIASYTQATSQLARQLMALGLIEGTPVQLIRSAPLGDPIELQVRGYRLSLRKAEAHCLRFLSL